MSDIVILPAATAHLDGLVASSAALFLEDGVARDRLRRCGRADGASW